MYSKKWEDHPVVIERTVRFNKNVGMQEYFDLFQDLHETIGNSGNVVLSVIYFS